MESKKLETEENVMEIDQFLMPFYIVEKRDILFRCHCM